MLKACMVMGQPCSLSHQKLATIGHGTVVLGWEGVVFLLVSSPVIKTVFLSQICENPKPCEIDPMKLKEAENTEIHKVNLFLVYT